MLRHLIASILAASVLMVSSGAQAAVVGSLSWDGVSDTFTSSENTSVSYIQFGLTKDKSYSDILNLLGTTFSGYHLASSAEAYTFANQMVTGSDPFPSNAATNTSAFDDDALGETEGPGWDFYIYGGPSNFGLIYTIGSQGYIELMERQGGWYTEGEVSGWSLRNGTGWLLVSNASLAAVPEPSTYAMIGLGLMALLGVSRRRQALV